MVERVKCFEETRSTRQRQQPSKFYKFFLVFIDVFINNYDIVDLFRH